MLQKMRNGQNFEREVRAPGGVLRTELCGKVPRCEFECGQAFGEFEGFGVARAFVFERVRSEGGSKGKREAVRGTGGGLQ